MSSSFMTQTSSFFDELSKILDGQRKDRDDGIEQQSDRPYSSMLTQDEEPSAEYNPDQMEQSDYEVVTRR